MDIWSAIGLGGVQGVTEFLPVSSTAHLALAQYFLQLSGTPIFFDVMLHIGTLIAVAVYYRRWIASFTKNLRSGAEPTSPSLQDANPSGRSIVWLGAMIVLATMPAVAASLIFRPTKPTTPPVSEQSAFSQWRHKVGDMREHSDSSPAMVAGFLTVTGCVLLLGSRAKPGEVRLQDIGIKHALLIGLAQACSATCPGLSRSGMTISTALLLGLRGEAAVHFSLLMSIPAVLGAAVLKTAELDKAWLTPGNILATAVGIATSAIVGWFCILLLMKSVQRNRWWWFSIYVWILAATVGLMLTFKA